MSDMNPEDRKRFDAMQSDIKEIKDALLGNHLVGDNGFKGQMESLNARLELQEKEIKILREERVENRVYIVIIKGLFALLAGSIITLIFKKF